MRNLEEEGMARRVHLHMDLNETDASLIKTAAKLSRVQPSHYVLNRVLRVAELEIKEWRERLAGYRKKKGPDFRVAPLI